jgi:hypothetical protein
VDAHRCPRNGTVNLVADKGVRGVLVRMGWLWCRGQAAAGGLLRCAKPGQARSLIQVGQIARVSSVKAVATRSVVGSALEEHRSEKSR